MDVWINFKNATKWQAEGIFRCFFPAAKPASSPETSVVGISEEQEHLTIPKRKSTAPVVPSLPEEEICILAKRFADAIPDDEFSVSIGIIFHPESLIDFFDRLPPCKVIS